LLRLRLLKAEQEGLEQRAACFGLALQLVQLHRLRPGLTHLTFDLIEACAQRRVARSGGLGFVAQSLHDESHLGADLALDVVRLRLAVHHLRMFRPIGRLQLGDMARDLRLLLLQGDDRG
jgi:hypothetical protein